MCDQRIYGGNVKQQIPNLAGWRERQYLSQSELARRAGISNVTVWRIEHGEAVTHRTIRRIADALGISPAELTADAIPA